MAIGKQELSFLIGEIFQSANGTLWGRINGQKVFLKEVTDRDGKQKWLVNQSVNAYLTDPKPKQNEYDPDFQG